MVCGKLKEVVTVGFIVLVILLPVIMIFSGCILIKFPPKNINSVMGYRTKASMKSTEAWTFAQDYSGKLMLKTSSIVMPITVIVFIAVWLAARHSSALVYVALGLVLVQLVVVAAITVFCTERELKRRFPNSGT